ncbi:hypothetical protein [Spirosoma foliorum]|uniref:Uncharacterized protein n=1 Tax=Spirosoma foliorum TaxID=2710596 RepID=A0A7G5GV19_9BACT|nr:hypothetical protein [Spirosoma foliorum]QMW02711.1 hypothetical protein H3H32_33225 [Spirosoma foliorum]
MQHDRAKQAGTRLVQTVDVTPRALRLLEKYNGSKGLFYGSNWSKQLKTIARLTDLRDPKTGEFIRLLFGMGCDTGLTARGIRSDNDMQMTRLGGWSSTRPARRYIGLDLKIIAGFATNSSVVSY